MKAENYLGQVGELIRFITPTITVSLDEYSIGDCIGGKIKLANLVRVNNATAKLKRLLIKDASGSAPQFNILVFSSDPTAATLTDNAVAVLSTDLSKLIAVIPVVTEDYETIDSTSLADKLLEDVYIQSIGGRDVYIALIATATVTFSAASDLTLTVKAQRN